MVGRTACWAVLAAIVGCALTACGGGHAAPAAAPVTTAPDVSVERLAAAVPTAGELPDRLLVEGNVVATSELTVVDELSGRAAELYALVPPGATLNPRTDEQRCEITYGRDDGTEATRRVQAAAFANLHVCQGQLGCGPVVVASIAGESQEAAKENADKIADYEACLAQIGYNGPPVDGRFLLQPAPAPASAAAALPVAVVVYPSAEAFTTSVRDVAASSAFGVTTVVGRFEPPALPGCALQFYPATASALVWCGGHDPEHDAAVGGIAKQLSGVEAP